MFYGTETLLSGRDAGQLTRFEQTLQIIDECVYF
jgi:hypothetical protein